MQLDSEAMKPVVNRIKRAQGQLAGVVRMLEDGRECDEVITQLAEAPTVLTPRRWRDSFCRLPDPAGVSEQCLAGIGHDLDGQRRDLRVVVDQ